MIDNFLFDLQDAVLNRLKSMPWFATVNLFAEQQTFAADVLNQALAGYTGDGGKTGAACIVKMPRVLSDLTQSPGGAKLRVQVQVEVRENELFNRNPDTGTLLSCDRIAAQVYQALKGFKLGRTDMADPLAEGPQPIMPFKGDDTDLHIMVALACGWGLDFDPQVQMPVSFNAGLNLLGLQSATEGATVVYTMDGSYPWAGNAAAEVYSGPVAITADTVVRAIAYLAGDRPSNEWAKLVAFVPVVNTVDTDGNDMVDTDGNNVVEASS